MSLTDGIRRNKWANAYVPDKDRKAFIAAVDQWDKQNPTLAGTYSDNVMRELLKFVQGNPNYGLPPSSQPTAPSPSPTTDKK